MIVVAADADFALDAVVEGRHFGVIDGPVLAGAIVVASFKIALAEAESDGVPQLGFAAEAAAALAIEAGFAGLHDGDVAGRKLVRQRVGVEIGAGIDFGAA